MLNNLRSRIAVETDGQLKTGRDVIIATLLEAKEFKLRHTAPRHARLHHDARLPPQCLLVGIATQDARLRENFTGDPEHTVNFMKFIAQEVRELMAELGFRTINELVGRTDALEARKAVVHWKAKGIDLSKLLYSPPAGPEVGRYCTDKQDHGLDKSLDLTTLLDLCTEAGDRA